jgi:beta-galactosidase
MDYYRDTPAITANAYARGMAYYVGTELRPTVMKAFMTHVLGEAGVKPLIASAPEGVEVTSRRGKDSKYIFLLNHNRTAVDLAIPTGWTPLIGREFARNNVLHLAPFEVAVCISA